MKLRDYLKDQRLLLIGWLLFVLLTAFVMWLTPGLTVDWGSVLYLALMEFVLLLFFLLGHFMYKKYWWQKLTITENESPLQNYLSGARTRDEQLQENYINQLIAEHQQGMQEFVVNQEEQKDYIDSWVHEIKVPLAATQLLLQSLEYDIPDDKYLQLENELNKIDSYVEQVLYFARMDSFSKDYLIQDTSLKSVIQPVLRSQANYIIQKNLHYEIIGEDQTVLTDGKWLGFIFQQLLSNAIKYTPANGKLTITITKNTQGIGLALTDTGIGIPPADLQRIFDKGFTGQNGRFSEMHSTGLGLYLARNLSQQLGIELRPTSTVGQGTTMTLFFPRLSFYQEER